MSTMALRKSPFTRTIALTVLIAFAGLLPASPSLAQVAYLPTAGVMVNMTPKFDPMLVKGIKLYTDNPFKFDFIVDTGDEHLSQGQIKDQGQKLAAYFLASLTTPEPEMWVNLSPYEHSRIIPKAFGDTEMGKELLSEDYLLKQIMATAIYPERQLGQEFWQTVYARAQQQFGTTDVPVNTFNKVWIVPGDAVVYENAKMNAVFVVQSRLKVLLEQDYLAANKHKAMEQYGMTEAEFQKNTDETAMSKMSSNIIKEIVIPALEKEVNEGRNFAGLRQVYQSLILAAWYKKNLKDNVLSQGYVDRNKTLGIDTRDKQITEKIYRQYLKAYKKGVYNYIKEDLDPQSNQVIPRKYFSGGFEANGLAANLAQISDGNDVRVRGMDNAMNTRASIATMFSIAVGAVALFGAFNPTLAAPNQAPQLNGTPVTTIADTSGSPVLNSLVHSLNFKAAPNVIELSSSSLGDIVQGVNAADNKPGAIGIATAQLLQPAVFTANGADGKTHTYLRLKADNPLVPAVINGPAPSGSAGAPPLPPVAPPAAHATVVSPCVLINTPIPPTAVVVFNVFKRVAAAGGDSFTVKTDGSNQMDGTVSSILGQPVHITHNADGLTSYQYPRGFYTDMVNRSLPNTVQTLANPNLQIIGAAIAAAQTGTKAAGAPGQAPRPLAAAPSISQPPAVSPPATPSNFLEFRGGDFYIAHFSSLDDPTLDKVMGLYELTPYVSLNAQANQQSLRDHLRTYISANFGKLPTTMSAPTGSREPSFSSSVYWTARLSPNVYADSVQYKAYQTIKTAVVHVQPVIDTFNALKIDGREGNLLRLLQNQVNRFTGTTVQILVHQNSSWQIFTSPQAPVSGLGIKADVIVGQHVPDGYHVLEVNRRDLINSIVYHAQQGDLADALRPLMAKVDLAMIDVPDMNAGAVRIHAADNGGIDLENVSLNTQGSGVRTAFSDPRILQMLMEAKGLFPEVKSVEPVTVPMVDMLLGFNAPAANDNLPVVPAANDNNPAPAQKSADAGSSNLKLAFLDPRKAFRA